MRVAVAGTFDVLHDGHRSLLMRAFEIGDYICIGITNDEMASERRDRIIPLEIRRSVLETYLKGMRKPWEVFVIEDKIGRAHV